VVVSADAFNRSSIRTVTALVLTSNIRQADAPGNVLLPSGTAGLVQDSVANVTQMVTVDKGDLEDHPVGSLSGALMQRIDAGLGLALALP